MKKVVLVLAVGVLVFSFFATVAPAQARLSFEDPQVCLNGKLLVVEPTTAGVDVWLNVGPKVSVDLNVANCGGDPTQPAVQASHVKYKNIGNWVELDVKTKKFTDVNFNWNGTDFTKNSGKDGWIEIDARVN